MKNILSNVSQKFEHEKLVVNMGQDGDEGKEILQKMLEHDTVQECWPNYVVKAKKKFK